jgi:predicted nuclease of predicted toxin-antitoxin system
MRILLDEILDWRLGRDLPGHQVDSVPLLGWAGIQNGELLKKAIGMEFDAFVTMDGNMLHQRKIARSKIAVIALRAKSNRLDDTRPLMSQLLALLPQLKPGTLTYIPEP